MYRAEVRTRGSTPSTGYEGGVGKGNVVAPRPVCILNGDDESTMNHSR